MRLGKLHVDGLGLEQTRCLEFGAGVNAIYGASGSGKSAISSLLKQLLCKQAVLEFTPAAPCALGITYEEDGVSKGLTYRFDGLQTTVDGNHPTTLAAANLTPIYFLGGSPVGQIDVLLDTASQIGLPLTLESVPQDRLRQLEVERQGLVEQLSSLAAVDPVDVSKRRRVRLEDKLAELRLEIEELAGQRDRQLNELKLRLETISEPAQQAKQKRDDAQAELDDYRRLLEEHTQRRKRERLEFIDDHRAALEKVERQLLDLMEMIEMLRCHGNKFIPSCPETYTYFQKIELSTCEGEQLEICVKELEAMIVGLESKRQFLMAELSNAELSEEEVAKSGGVVCGICCGEHEHCKTILVDDSKWEIPEWQAAGLELSPEHLKHLNDLYLVVEKQHEEIATRVNELQTECHRLENLPELQELEAAARELRNEIQAVRSLIDIAKQREHVEARMGIVVEQIDRANKAEEALRIFGRASDLLAEISGGRYEAIEVHRVNSVSVKTADSRRSWHELPCGVQSSVYFCLSIALVERLREHGIHFPLVLDDLFAQIDSERDRAIAALIAKIAEHDQQLLVFTRHRHVPLLFEGRDDRHLSLMGNREISVPVEAKPEPKPEPKPKRKASTKLRVWSESLHVDVMPSVNDEDCERLNAIGVKTLQDMIDLDVAADQFDWSQYELQQDQVWRWQLHAMLLCFVPNLRGSDAVLLTACGVTSPASLCEFEASELDRRVRKFFNRGVRSSVEATRRPSLERLGDWIRWASKRRAQWIRRAGERSLRPMVPGSGILVLTAEQSEAGEELAPTVSRHHEHANRGKRSGRKVRQTSQQHEQVESQQETTEFADEPCEQKFFLELDSPIVDAPSIGVKMAERLGAAGVDSVQGLLDADAEDLAAHIDNRRVKVETIRQWQREAKLVCSIPQLRGHDAQILVACDVSDVDMVADMDVHMLWGIVQPLVASKQGQRIIRNGKAPDLEEVRDWITWSQQARSLEAA